MPRIIKYLISLLSSPDRNPPPRTAVDSSSDLPGTGEGASYVASGYRRRDYVIIVLIIAGPLLILASRSLPFRSTAPKASGILARMALSEIDDLHSEKQYAITHLPALGDSTLLRIHLSAEDSKKTWKSEALVIQDMEVPEPVSVCMLMRRVDRFGTVDLTARSVPITSTVKSVSTLIDEVGNTKGDAFGVESDLKYILKEDGSQKLLEGSTTISGLRFRMTYFGEAISRFPDRPLKPGESSQFDWSVPSDAPPAVKSDPPTLVVKFVERAKFAGRDAALLEAKSRRYILREPTGTRVEGVESELLKLDTELRQYVELASGRTLWSEETDHILGPEKLKKELKLMRVRSIASDLNLGVEHAAKKASSSR